MKEKTETKAVPYNASTKRQERARILVALKQKLPTASKARIKRLADIGICHPTFSMDATKDNPCGDRPACEFGLAVCGGKCRYPPYKRDTERGTFGIPKGVKLP